MKFAVIQFPGSTGDRELLSALQNVLKVDAELVKSTQDTLSEYDAIIIPGGFSYGDYLRPGAIAKLDPVIQAIKTESEAGKLVIGIGNGFQILTEAGLLPGAFVQNDSSGFINQKVTLTVENNETAVSNKFDAKQQVEWFIAHEFGNYFVKEADLTSLKENNQIVFTYANENPNGSTQSIAGISNKEGNIFGIMARPERSTEEIFGEVSGLKFFESVIASASKGDLN